MKTTFVPFPLPQARTMVPEQPAIMTASDIRSRLLAGLSLTDSDVELVEKAPSDAFFNVKADKIVDVLKWLRDETSLEFNFLQVISASDFVDLEATEDQEAVKARVEILYVLYSLALKTYLNVKVVLDRQKPVINTVSHLFRAANWYERECYDMIGVQFTNHPYHERVLLPPDWVGHPLRKDYVFPEEYNGMKVPL